jgi:regulator of nucleoside diphosphate kinase
MNMLPAITLNRLDVERLERLLETPDAAALPMAAALRDEIDRASVVRPEEIPPGVVTMNSVVHCRDEISGLEHRLTLVYPREADTATDKVSVLAPVGAALLGLAIGQSIDWQAPGGRLHLRVLDIVYQPEQAGDLHR